MSRGQPTTQSVASNYCNIEATVSAARSFGNTPCLRRLIHHDGDCIDHYTSGNSQSRCPYDQNIHRHRFPKKQQHPRCRELGRIKKVEFLRARHAPTPPKRAGAMLALPCHVKRSGDSSAGFRRDVRDIRWRHLPVQNYDGFCSFLTFDRRGCCQPHCAHSMTDLHCQSVITKKRSLRGALISPFRRHHS